MTTPLTPNPAAARSLLRGDYGDVLTVAECAELFGMKPSWVRERIRRGQIPRVFPDGDILIPAGGLLAILCGCAPAEALRIVMEQLAARTGRKTTPAS